ncbi:hypothetical protein KRR55_06175 [Paeniglutamicibacter sp. ABSL32-1]|uniref:hypothetical protein n=1 Tax=Paeniglutamicibacter quisquiliarum TaxID=2849498 RepID=UPI001C2DB0D2|nr:hypothetical protein [Paeniglutamicibacter quisquiliarum]MBV1778699.1 hypothetical protein [Paeniglutamicibacter quisquiliarum]
MNSAEQELNQLVSSLYTQQQVEQMLDRLEASKPDYSDMDSYNRSFLEAMYKGTIDKAIQAERDELKRRGATK